MKKNIEVKGVKKKSIMDFDISIGNISLLQKSIFAKHMAILLKSGINLVDALQITIEDSNGRMKKIIKKVVNQLIMGNTLSDSLSKFPKVFNKFFINSVKIGENTGSLEENFKIISVQLEKEQQLVSKIRGAMLYPIVILSASVILGGILSFIVLPKITPLFEGLKIDLPLSTRILIWISNFMQDHGGILLILSITFIFLLFFILRLKIMHPITHWIFLRFPIISKISRNANLIRFNRGLGMLLRSGINIDQALLITSETLDNYYYSNAVAKIAEGIKKGGKLKTNLEAYGSLFPKLTTNMIGVGEESGSLDETLISLSDFYEFEVENAAKSLSTIIEPLMLIFIGLVVALIASSIITPIYMITGSIKP